ncbi:MAG: T9SS type A sorting domain-containing protein [Bacteroidetes bacterium]|nr:T9SS type A sorting domain-containing protein [Bacteroidota bacterium]
MKTIITFIASITLLVTSGFTQSQSGKPIVIKANYFDISPPLREMVNQFSVKADQSWKENVVKNALNVYSPGADNSDPNFIDPVQQMTFGQVQSDTTIQNFEGIGAAGSLPPDTDGDVSSNYYFQVVNTKYKIFNKTGGGVYGPFNNNTVFTGLPNNTNDGDAIVLYDEKAGRWLFSQFALPNYPNGPFYQNVAISQTNDPTGSWYRYQFTFSDMPDYPKLSVWQDAYYMTVRRFASGSGNWLGPAAVAMDRTKMLAGDAAPTMVMFNLPSSSEGPLSLDCDSDFPPAGTPNYVSYLVQNPAQLNMYEFHVDWGNTSNSTFNLATSVPISSFSTMGSNVIPQLGTSKKLDAFSRKGLMFRMPFRKFNSYWSVVASFTVSASGKAGVRWMELRNSGSGWSLYQEGTYAPDATNHRWMPSIAMDTSGNIALGYSISSSTMYPSIRYTGRLKSDALGTMSLAEKGIINGGGCQTDNSGRWGDYSAMSVDPSAPGTFWYTTEYYSSTSDASWQTRIASFSIGTAFASYATAAPGIICQGADSIQLKSVAYGGSGTYTYSWTSVPAGFTSALKEPKAAPAVDTKYIVAVSDGSKTRIDTTNEVTVMGTPYTFAGNDTIVEPSLVSIDLHGIANNYRAFQWQTTGNGTFGSVTQLNTTYTFGTIDKTNGTVTLKLTAVPNPPCSGNFTSTRTIYLWPLGIPKNTSSGLAFNIQPNPAWKNVSILISGLENTYGVLTILNMNGTAVYSSDITPSSTVITKEIDLSSFSKGIYIVRLRTDRSVAVKQLVVQ